MENDKMHMFRADQEGVGWEDATIQGETIQGMLVSTGAKRDRA